jgi:hypothetical protein
MPGTKRTDLEAILLTGIPSGPVKNFTNYTGPVMADMLRLNTSIPPSAKPSMLGLLGGDLAGFPNGRRPGDDVVTIELRALAGYTYPLVDTSYRVDQAASAISDFNRPPSAPRPPARSPISGRPTAVTATCRQPEWPSQPPGGRVRARWSWTSAATSAP